MRAYLRPYWLSREIYNETATFIGEGGEATLMFTPTEVLSVRSYDLSTTYRAGVDYTIEGRTIRRLPGGAIPYWEPEEYFPAEPSRGIPIAVNRDVLDFDLPGDRFLLYGEMDFFTKKQVAVTYRHEDEYDGPAFLPQPEKLTRVLDKLSRGEDIRVMVYGDSVAVGCNASGTHYGGNINPHMPNFATIVCDYIHRETGSTVHLENQAVGGWKIANCLEAYDEKIAGKPIDLLILRIGGNDSATPEEAFASGMDHLLERFFADHPDANVILQTPDLPNTQSTWVFWSHMAEPWTVEAVERSPHKGQMAVARVQSFTEWLESRGKRTRDRLANNINHSNDFLIRSYAQIILTTLFGTRFTEA